MCGILVCINQKSTENKLFNALDSMRHRGPDDSGFIKKSWFWAGFNRLSILDLSKNGHQPMEGLPGQFILHNGEVYNFKEIRSELQSKGYSFKSNTDTEVIIKAFHAWGNNAFTKFIGMYASVIIDQNTNQVHLFRDQSGVKPLYYFTAPNGEIIIVSEPKALKSLHPLQMNREKINEILLFRSIVGNATPIKNLHSVLPGENITIKKNGLITKNYFASDNSSLDIQTTKKYDDILTEAENLIISSIKYRLISDVEIGLQLSGGVDSSLIAAIIQTHFKKQELHSFSISFPENKFDESYYQKIVAEKYGITHHNIEFNEEDFINYLNKATWHEDFPIIHPNSLAIMKLTKYAKQYVTVLLSGEGADETFLGYPKYRILAHKNIINLTNKVPGLTKLLPPIGKLKTLKNIISLKGDFSELFIKNSQTILKNMLIDNSDDLVEKRLNYVQTHNLQPETSLPKYDQFTSLIPLLMRFDRMSMSASIEGRVPFCDHRLIEFTNSLPLKYKISRAQLKILLKEIASKYLPHDLIYRPKMGFSLPLEKWMNSTKLTATIDILREPEFLDKNIVNQNMLTQILNTRPYTQDIAENIIWPLLSVELWHRTIIKD